MPSGRPGARQGWLVSGVPAQCSHLSARARGTSLGTQSCSGGTPRGGRGSPAEGHRWICSLSGPAWAARVPSTFHPSPTSQTGTPRSRVTQPERRLPGSPGPGPYLPPQLGLHATLCRLPVFSKPPSRQLLCGQSPSQGGCHGPVGKGKWSRREWVALIRNHSPARLLGPSQVAEAQSVSTSLLTAISLPFTDLLPQLTTPSAPKPPSDYQ